MYPFYLDIYNEFYLSYLEVQRLLNDFIDLIKDIIDRYNFKRSNPSKANYSRLDKERDYG